MNKSIPKKQSLLNKMIEELDLPKSIIDKAHSRYYSLADWFNREESSIKDVDIFIQGSFAQGTTIKPLSDNEEYDVDMSCKVNIDNYKQQYSQADLMKLVKNELELYRKNVGIHSTVEEKRRCLRLVYKDEVSFHLDFVPSIPLNDNEEYRNLLFKHYQNDDELASKLSILAVNIPDKENDNYNTISGNWHISNQQGYLLWFQSKIKKEDKEIVKSSIEQIPNYNQKSVLQRCIQLLKRHRDTMFYTDEIQDSKPISIIITTLAARAYNGEKDIDMALMNILNKMDMFINQTTPRIPNPVKPEEDFTDRWDDPKYKELKLEENFYLWLTQAKIDFQRLVTERNAIQVSSVLTKAFSLEINESILKRDFDYIESTPSNKKTISNPTTKPWLNI